MKRVSQMTRFLIATRWFIATVVAYTCLFILCSAAIVVCILTLGWRKHAYFYLVSRAFGCIYLRLVGVKIVYDDGLPFQTRQSRIMTFNHTSQLDLFIMATLMPPGGVPTMKKEMLYVPILGQLLLLFGAVMVNRGKQSSAHASLASGATRIGTEALTVGISPEGTRAADGELAAFKKGTFHLAKAANVDVHRVLLSTPHVLQPLGQWYVFPGTIHVTHLKVMPCPTELDNAEDWTSDLRKEFVHAIEEWRENERA